MTLVFYFELYLKIWNKENLKATGELDANQCPVTCVAVKGNILYAGTSGGNIVVWDIEKATIIRELNEHQGSLAKIRVFGDLVVSGDTEGKVYNFTLLYRLPSNYSSDYRGEKQMKMEE